MNDINHISQDDLTLYALHALSSEESNAYKAHLEGCAECRKELALLHGDLALLALSTEQHALPQGARERFLNRVESTAQQQAPVIPNAPVVQMPQRGEPGSLRFWQAIAAVLVLAVGLMGYRIYTMQGISMHRAAEVAHLRNDNAKAEQVLEVLTAASAQRVVLAAANATPQPTGTAVYLADRGALVFQANHLHALPAGKTYELWVIPANGKAPIPAGLFQPDVAGNGSVVLPTLPKGVPAKAFGVTMEEARGSTTPTAPILLVGAATS